MDDPRKVSRRGTCKCVRAGFGLPRLQRRVSRTADSEWRRRHLRRMRTVVPEVVHRQLSGAASCEACGMHFEENHNCANRQCPDSPSPRAIELDIREIGRCPSCGTRMQWTGAQWFIPYEDQ